MSKREAAEQSGTTTASRDTDAPDDLAD